MKIKIACNADLCAKSLAAQEIRETMTIKQAFDLYEQEGLSCVGDSTELETNELQHS